MSMKSKTAGHVYSGNWFIATVVCFLLTLYLLISPLCVSAVGNSGWVEVRVSVPKGFDETIIVTFVQEDTYEEFACRVLEVNNYVTILELPSGKYTFDGAFLESSDFRYSTSLINDAQDFEVSADPNAAAALIELKTVYNEEFSDGAGLPEATEPTEEETVAKTEPVTEPSEGENVTSESEPLDDDVNSEPSEEEESGFKLKDRLIRYGVATGIFIAVVFLVAFLLRRHMKIN